MVDVECFQKDIKTMSVEECCKKHKVKLADIMQLLIKLDKKKTVLENREDKPRKVSENKYIGFKSKRYFIHKHKDGEKYTYGNYRTIEEARTVRDELVKCDWDSSQYQSILKRNNIQELPFSVVLKDDDAYIQKTKYDTFSIKKSTKLKEGWRVKYYGTYNTIEDARKIRDELIKHNWDKTKLSRIKKKLGIKNTFGR